MISSKSKNRFAAFLLLKIRRKDDKDKKSH